MKSLRRPLPIVLALMLGAGPVWAAPKEEGAKAKPRRIITQPAKVSDDLGLRPALSLGPPPALALPGPMSTALSGGLSSGGLAAGGLRSTLPQMGDGGGQCRSRCTQTRVVCDAEEGSPECASRWSICTADCAR